MTDSKKQPRDDLGLVLNNDRKHQETTLMLDRHSNQLIPLSTYAFSHASGPFAEVRRKNIGNTLIFRDGSVRRILDIERLGYEGRGLAKVLGALSRAHVIATKLSDAEPHDFAALRDRVRAMVKPEDGYLELPNDIDRLLANCRTCDEMFEALRLPPPEDALDLMC